MTSREMRFNAQIVALHGLAGVGKNSIADYLVKDHGYTKVAFSDALCAAVADAYNIEPDYLRRADVKDTPVEQLCLFHCSNGDYRDYMVSARKQDLYTPRSGRYHLDMFGADYTQSRNPGRWMRETLARIKALEDSKVVVPDLRSYRDYREWQGLKAFSRDERRPLCVMRISRQGVVAPSDHEAHLPLPDYMIDCHVSNDEGDLSGTCTRVVRKIEGWFGGLQSRED